MKSNIKVNSFLRFFLGLIFISAGLYRVFNWQDAVLELSNLNLTTSSYLIWLIIGLEIIGGLFLILNIKIKKTLLILIIFLTCAIALALIFNGNSIFVNLKELFIFNPTPTDTFLHLIYLGVLFYIFKKR